LEIIFFFSPKNAFFFFFSWPGIHSLTLSLACILLRPFLGPIIFWPTYSFTCIITTGIIWRKQVTP
jgi:hypothetical protein